MASLPSGVASSQLLRRVASAIVRFMKLLANYLTDRQLTQRAFAKLIAAPPPQISMWLSGRRRPGLDYALAIERVTEGQVPASSWKRTKNRKAAQG